MYPHKVATRIRWPKLQFPTSHWPELAARNSWRSKSAERYSLPWRAQKDICRLELGTGTSAPFLPHTCKTNKIGEFQIPHIEHQNTLQQLAQPDLMRNLNSPASRRRRHTRWMGCPASLCRLVADRETKGSSLQPQRCVPWAAASFAASQHYCSDFDKQNFR